MNKIERKEYEHMEHMNKTLFNSENSTPVDIKYFLQISYEIQSLQIDKKNSPLFQKNSFVKLKKLNSVLFKMVTK